MWPTDEPQPARYKSAAICRRGHVFANDIEDQAQIPARCVECGAEVLTACPECGYRLRGYYEIPLVVHGDYDRPSFCDRCGSPCLGSAARSGCTS
jgi:hypothetical protein